MPLKTVGSPLVNAAGISRTFGETEVLSNCSLSLAQGEVAGLVGPNGAGKSTLLRILAGFDLPSSGEVSIAGRPVAESRAMQGLGYLPDELPRPWSRRVGDLLGLRASAEEMSMSPDEALSALGIPHIKGERMDRLSKGQWRLVLTAYASVGPPQVLILDEPDSGLDPSALDRLQHLARNCADAGAAVLISSHQLVLLEDIADRIHFLRDGRIASVLDGLAVRAKGLRSLYRDVFGG